MSTIASPRETSLPPARRIPSSSTPTSSARPSLESSRSPGPGAQPGPPTVAKRANRAALREYYKLKAEAAQATGPPRIEVPDSEVPSSDLDAKDFDAQAYLEKVAGDSGLEALLRLYTRVVAEVRALDAEKKALVYDNYSKLIDATETIRKMRSNMDPLNPMASTLNPAINHIYSQANSIRESLREHIPKQPDDEDEAQKIKTRQRTKELAQEVLATPEHLRRLVAEGRVAEAKAAWEMPRRLLETWKQKGLGGDDVQKCIDEGDAALRVKEEN